MVSPPVKLQETRLAEQNVGPETSLLPSHSLPVSVIMDVPVPHRCQYANSPVLLFILVKPSAI